jgi:outer membrane receptor for ferrienterochelin and colicin
MEYGWIGYPTGEHLKNETAMEYEAGIIQKFGTAGSCRCAYYYYDIENYILFNEALNPRAAEMAGSPVSDSIFNLDHVKIQGIETEVSFQLSAALTGYFNYTYHDLQMSSVTVSEGVAPPDIYRIPRHTINAGIRWSPLQHTKIMLSVKYSDERKTSRGETVGSFWIADTGFEQYFWNKKLRISGYVNNLFDKAYEEKYGIPAPERRLGICVRYLY